MRRLQNARIQIVSFTAENAIRALQPEQVKLAARLREIAEEIQRIEFAWMRLENLPDIIREKLKKIG